MAPCARVTAVVSEWATVATSLSDPGCLAVVSADCPARYLSS